MVSVLISTQDNERLLVQTLAALVPGALAGLVREVIVADGGSRDGTRAIADLAGCRILSEDGSSPTRLAKAALVARAPWLMFLAPGQVPEGEWIAAVERFLLEAEAAPSEARAATFRRRTRARTSWLRSLRSLVGLHDRGGLVVRKDRYLRMGGHREGPRSEIDLLARIGRRQVTTLTTLTDLAG